jgi:hypothetical protein
MLYRGHRFLGDINHFGWPWDCGRWTSFWKTLHDKNVRKYDQREDFVRSDRRLTVITIGSELNLIHQTVHDILTEELGMRTLRCCITTTLPVTLPSPWTNCLPKSVFQWFRIHHTRLMSPCDFFLFPKLTFHLKGRHFGSVDNIQKVVTDQLRAHPHEDFQPCYRKWEQRLRRCVVSQGNYSEGDDVDF